MANIKNVTLGSTGISVPQNGFGALPIQRVDFDTSDAILRRAYEGGMRFFDTARAYSDSEEKIGHALSDVRNNFVLATKTGATTPEEMKKHLDTSLSLLKTDHIDIYQFHCANQVFAPEDGTGMYELMEDFKRQGIIINQCARMSLMLRRAPSEAWLNDYWQAAMADIEKCISCGKCKSKCPYELNTPELLKKNYEDYKDILNNKKSVK